MLRNHSLATERLENRELMAGDVSVGLVNGDLIINGDAHDNVVEVYRLSSGKTRVAGVDTRINGRSYQDFRLTDDLFINMPKGNNDVSFLNYNGGVRADLVDVAMSATGDDRLTLTSLHARGDVRVETLGGDDSVQFRNTSVGTGIFDRENLLINTGDGEDEVMVMNSVIFGEIYIETYFNPHVRDTDVVELRSVTVFDDLYIATGSGRDYVTVQSCTIIDDVGIYTSLGNDVVNFENNHTDDVTIDVGIGVDDFLVVSHNTADNVRLTCNDDGAFDMLVIYGNDFDSLVETNWDIIRRAPLSF